MPFDQGSRTCIRTNIGLLEIGELKMQLVRHFDSKMTRSLDELVSENYWFDVALFKL